jgi:hypothetical protein
MRRRANKEKVPADESPLMDEDEQEEVVALLKQEGTQQIKRMNNIFTAICILAIAMTLVVIAFHGSSVMHLAHGIYSVGVYWLARAHATMASCAAVRSSVWSNMFALLILLVLSPLLVLASYSLAIKHEDGSITLHWSIALANLLVALCSILLRMESVNTFKALESLEGSKYQYKSL